MKVVNIIGAGLAGSITATLLRANGFECRVIDDNDVYSASQASSNLFVAQWYKGIAGAEEGFAVLEQLYGGATEKPFSAGIGIATKMLHIPQRAILVQPDIVHTVTYADAQGVTLGDGRSFEGPIVLCCGYRHNALGGEGLELDIEVYAGHRYLFKGDLKAGGRLDMVAPYKHGKLYQYAPGVIYYADSVKIKLNEYRKREDELRARTLERAQKALFSDPATPLPEIIDFRVGYRPVIKSSPFATLGGGVGRPNKVYYINGGGKNGCVAYAFRAKQLLEDLKKTGLDGQ